MSNLDYLCLKTDLERLEESLNERLGHTVSIIDYILAWREVDEDTEDDFAGGTSGVDGSPWMMPWRSHLTEFRFRLKEDGYDKAAEDLAQLAAVTSLKKPFTQADETDVIKSILEYLADLKKEIRGEGRTV